MHPLAPEERDHGGVRSLNRSRPPPLDGDAEVQQLVTTHRREPGQGATLENDVAVDLAGGDLLEPAVADRAAREGMGVLSEHVGEAENCCCSWISRTAGTSSAVIGRRSTPCIAS